MMTDEEKRAKRQEDDGPIHFKETTEADMICHNCVHRGERLGMVVSKCEVYTYMKPFIVLGGEMNTDNCIDYSEEV